MAGRASPEALTDYIIGRLAHGLGMDGGSLGKGRMVGTLITMITLLGLSGWALSTVYTAL